MGSTNATGISVVDKQNLTFRNRGGRQIVKSDSRADVETTIVSAPPERIAGSGSIVRQDGSVEYNTGIVNGLYMGGRSSSARVASTNGGSRDLDVELGDNKTIATVPDGLSGTIPQIGVTHTGAKLVVSNSHDDSYTRASDSGSLTNH